MTKTSIRNYLKDTLEELGAMTEPEEFEAKLEEMFSKLEALPYAEDRKVHAQKMIELWKKNFNNDIWEIKNSSMMRKSGSINKQFYKPALSKRTKDMAVVLLGINISSSLIPE